MVEGTAAVVGSGPNGLAAAITLARAGLDVTVHEGRDIVGGGTASTELLGAGMVTDTCSAVHPFGIGSPFFSRLGLERYGLEWIHPDVPMAHPLDAGPPGVLHRSLDATVDGLGPDGPAYRRLIEPLVRHWDALVEEVFGPVLHVPRAPLSLAAFGLRGVWPATWLGERLFAEPRTRALVAGMAAHAVLPLSHPLTAAFAVLFAACGHARGWPVAKGGSRAIADALAGHLTDLGGTIVTGSWVRSLDDVRPADLVLLDVTPAQLLAIAGPELDPRYRRSLQRFSYGPGAYKVDYLLDGPIPWRDQACRRAGTVHVGGTLRQVARAEAETAAGRTSRQPFVLVAQQSLFDDTRVTGGRQVAWAYCHVPNGSPQRMGAAIDGQIERFAPGFRDRIVARHESGPADLERENPNYVGGDIGGGSVGGLQLVFRPTVSADTYRTSIDGVYLCSSSTPPGGGVHGMCGYHAARSALARLRRPRRRPRLA